MKNGMHKKILAVLGYLWGSVLFALVASFGVTLIYRLSEGGLGVTEYLVTGAATLVFQLACVWVCFSRFGYRREAMGRTKLAMLLLAGGVAHFLVSIPFHFSVYAGGTPALYLTEYVYRLQNPNLPALMPFTEIPLGICMLGFLLVEPLVLAAAYVATRRGQAKRHKERAEITKN